MNNSNPVVIELIYPFEHEGKQVTSIALRRPTVGDTMKVQQEGATNAAEVELRMVSLLSGQAADVIAKLDMQDYLNIQAKLRVMVNPTAH
jgi:hypothetical protein